MKRLLYVLFSTVLSFSCLCACANQTEGSAEPRIRIVTTIFPEYSWIRSILGENPSNIDVTLLLDSGVDLHSYQPTMEDIRTISECDLFVYVGGESDEWVEDVLNETSNPNLTAVSLMEVLGDNVKEEELKEGMEHDHEEHEDEDHESEEHEEPEYDEHVWLSLRNADTLVRHLSTVISEKDPGQKAYYEAQTTEFLAKLNGLDQNYQSAVDTAEFDVLVFGDRFPFQYLCDDYGLNYYAAFAGCSAETEASFQTILFLADKLNEYGLSSILTIEGSSQKIAKTIIENTKKGDQNILTLDSMQGTTAADVENGADYLGIMEKNLETLKIALNK